MQTSRTLIGTWVNKQNTVLGPYMSSLPMKVMRRTWLRSIRGSGLGIPAVCSLNPRGQRSKGYRESPGRILLPSFLWARCLASSPEEVPHLLLGPGAHHLPGVAFAVTMAKPAKSRGSTEDGLLACAAAHGFVCVCIFTEVTRPCWRHLCTWTLRWRICHGPWTVRWTSCRSWSLCSLQRLWWHGTRWPGGFSTTSQLRQRQTERQTDRQSVFLCFSPLSLCWYTHWSQRWFHDWAFWRGSSLFWDPEPAEGEVSI